MTAGVPGFAAGGAAGKHWGDQDLRARFQCAFPRPRTPALRSCGTGRSGGGGDDTDRCRRPGPGDRGGPHRLRAPSSYKHWNAGHDATGRCNTRTEVLISEAVVAPTVEVGCKLSGGTWRSHYDGQEVTSMRLAGHRSHGAARRGMGLQIGGVASGASMWGWLGTGPDLVEDLRAVARSGDAEASGLV